MRNWMKSRGNTGAFRLRSGAPRTILSTHRRDGPHIRPHVREINPGSCGRSNRKVGRFSVHRAREGHDHRNVECEHVADHPAAFELRQHEHHRARGARGRSQAPRHVHRGRSRRFGAAPPRLGGGRQRGRRAPGRLLHADGPDDPLRRVGHGGGQRTRHPRRHHARARRERRRGRDDRAARGRQVRSLQLQGQRRAARRRRERRQRRERVAQDGDPSRGPRPLPGVPPGRARRAAVRHR